MFVSGATQEHRYTNVFQPVTWPKYDSGSSCIERHSLQLFVPLSRL